MSFGMKRGFLKQTAQEPSSRPVQPRTPQVSGTCQVYSETPYIMVADSMVPSFLILPSKNDARMAIVHSLDSVQTISKLPLWNDPWPSSPNDLPFEIKRCEKGMGMFARRAILQAEVIMRERAVYVVPHRLGGTPEQIEAFYDESLAGLSPSARASILSLHNCHPETTGGSHVRGLVQTNAFPISLSHTTGKLCGLFPILCRANHDCTPNAIYSSLTDSFTAVFRAVRAIAAGEEITVAYTSLTAPRVQRQRLLSEQYRFTCSCRTCSLPAVRAGPSDARRQAIGEFLATIPEGTSLARIKLLLSWAEEEGLVDAAWELCEPGLKIARKEGSHTEAIRFGFSWVKYIRLLEGDEGLGLGQETTVSLAGVQAMLDDEHLDDLTRRFATLFPFAFEILMR
ncbi:hypothetical protein FB45DRAFT_1102051 [Roridomyces roridus]|uniref:SET domain-containing protein n=1 Tax=Roridomyces roridus TaxID=1738132 RepID=A0AAD7FX38_9AGAR|nr:hypothetical protein FB45DRAFT_1102051 [Roridomyces roridus]